MSTHPFKYFQALSINVQVMDIIISSCCDFFYRRSGYDGMLYKKLYNIIWYIRPI